MHEIPNLTRSDMVFGRIDFAPKMDDLPEDFQNYNRNKFCKIAANLFFSGGKLADHGLAPREGVDSGKATQALQALLCSFEPSHEHKMAVTGYLIDQWFEPFQMEHENPHMKRAN